MPAIKTLTELKAHLTKIGYKNLLEKPPKTITIIEKSDRIGVLENVANKMKSYGAKYNPKGGSSSIGRTEMTGGYFVLVKSGGGGSGAGSDATKLTESAQCLYCAAHYSGKKYTQKDLKTVESKADIDETFSNIYKKLDDDWIKSCILGAEILKKKHNKSNYTFHRGSSWVNKLENHWKKLNKESGAFSNLNKWSPADIWMVTSAGSRVDLTKTKSIAELNSVLLKNLKTNDIVGVSLKKLVGVGKHSYMNASNDRPKWVFLNTTTGLRDFWSSGDGYILFEGGKIQFRKFGSTWQGEIKGKNANMGKISGGPIIGTLSALGITMIPQRDLSNRDDKTVKKFYEWYSGIPYHPKMKYDDFNIEQSKKDQNWFVSKIMTTQLFYLIEKQTQKKKEEITSSFLNYASSQSLLSGPYVKLS